MKTFLLFAITTILLCSCRSESSEPDFLYFKVSTTGSADSVTIYNKGLGISDYLYYDPSNDSLICRNLVDIEPNQYKTYVGRLNNEKYLDTMRNLVLLLQRYKNGAFPTHIPDGATYCGPEFYIEFKNSRGLHFNTFLLIGNDTLKSFSNFFYRLADLPWEKKLVSNSLIRGDSEIINSMFKIGLYKDRATPYIPLQCENGIDKEKIYGSWRSIVSGYNWPTIFRKMTFHKNGTIIFEKIYDGNSFDKTGGQFVISRKANEIIVKSDGTSHRSIITKLSDNCFEYILDNEQKDTVRLNKLLPESQ